MGYNPNVPPSGLALLSPSTLPTGPAQGTIPAPGTLNIISHSWASGQGMAIGQRPRTSYVSKLAGMLGMNTDCDILNLASPGQALAATNSYFGSGWDAVLQWIAPPATVGYGDVGGDTRPPYPTRSTSLTCIQHGVNDIPQGGPATWTSNGVQSYKNGLTTVISRSLAGLVYTANDATITNSGFTLNTNQASATAGQTQTATVNGSTLTITLPTSWPGGTMAVCFRSGVTGAAPVYGINFSGTASFASGSQDLSGGTQSYNTGNAVAVTKRFTTLAADAGKTLICTVNITSGAPTVTFDSWWREADVQGVVLVATLHRYNYQTSYSACDPVTNVPALNSAISTVVGAFGSNVQVVDVDAILNNRSAVLAAAITTNSQTTISVTTNGPNFPWQPGFAISVAQTSPTGAAAPENMWVTQVGASQVTGPQPTGTTLQLTVIRGANGTTALSSVSSGKWVADATWFQDVAPTITTAAANWDNLHMNEVGYSQIANSFYEGWISAQTALGGSPAAASFTSVTLKSRQRAALPPTNSGLWYPPDTGLSTVQPATNVVTALPFYITQPTIITAGGVEIVTPGTGGTPVIRMGIYNTADNGCWPTSSLVLDMGTFSAASISSTVNTACWQRLLPGFYWVCCVSQGAATTQPVLRSITGLAWPYIMTANNTPLAAAVTRPIGYQGGATQSGALTSGIWTVGGTQFGTPITSATTLTSVPRMWLQMQTPRTDSV